MRKFYMILFATVLSMTMHAQKSRLIKGDFEGGQGVKPEDITAVGDYLVMSGIYDTINYTTSSGAARYYIDKEVFIYDAAVDSLISMEFNPTYYDYTTYIYPYGASFNYPIAYGDMLYFYATNGSRSGIYSFDATTGDTTFVKEGSWKRPQIVDDIINYTDGSYGPIIKFDGTTYDTIMALDTLIKLQSKDGNWAWLNEKYILSGADLRYDLDDEPYVYDPAQPDTIVLLADIVPDTTSYDYSNPSDMHVAGDKAYFLAYYYKVFANASRAYLLWETDGTPEGTKEVSAFNTIIDSLTIDILYADGDMLYLAASIDQNKYAQQLFSLNTTSGTVTQISDIYYHNPKDFLKYGDWLYYSGGREGADGNYLTRTNGTDIQVVDTVAFNVSELAVLGDKIFFSGELMVDTIYTETDTTYISTGEELMVYEIPAIDTTITDLLINGTSIEGFDPAVQAYEHFFPYGHTEMPEITVTTSDTNATYEVTYMKAFPGTAYVTVYAEDFNYTATYTVYFQVALNYDATLSSITVDGVEVDGFDPETPSYTITFPSSYDASVIPDVEGFATDTADAVVEVTEATAIPGTAYIDVTAANGYTKEQYEVVFELSASINSSSKTVFNVYPTVTENDITVELGNSGGKIQVFNLAGKLVLSNEYAQDKVTVSLKEKGVYLIHISNDTEASVVKVTKF